jgi:uncharacterized ferritin-like protein (DUF455 family)
VTGGGGSDGASKGRVKASKLVVSLHGIAHAESYAIDLFWDLLARWVRHHAGC